ncbi:MAG: methionyl-tRNA formyltransferase [Bacteroidales bacterium]|nr:methionyl-tRNA formyltransferase [Bacteroidales bacterium]
MQKQDIRIVFMGTPDFAVPTLEALVTGGYNVVGVITMPDKPAGRGHKLQYSPVKQFALDHDLPLLQPEKLKDEAFIEALRAWKADLQIVVAFRMLPEVVWAMPRMGTFNLHAALLPQYRGAAPLNWAVINGDTVTGATTFFLDHQIDTGRIILKEPLAIGPEENVGSLHDRMMEMGKGLVTRTVDLLLEAEGDVSKVPTIDQNTLLHDLKASTGIDELRPAPKIFKETCELHFDQPVRRLHNLVRGLSPYPAAWTSLGDLSPVKVFRTSIVSEGKPQSVDKIGQIETDDKSFIHIICSDGVLALEELQLPGKKRMEVRALLNGFKLS